MLFRLTKLWCAIGLLAAVWGLGTVHRSEPRGWIRPIGTRPGPVRIVQFYANVNSLTAGSKAMLCYGVENAKSVRIAPISQTVNPAFNRCIEIGPDHTTHYTILAEGFDGKVAMKSFVLRVDSVPLPPRFFSEELPGEVAVAAGAA